MKKIKIAGVDVMALTKSDLVAINPAKAEALLNNNDNFRKINKTEIEKYSNLIKNDDWKFNGDTIAFNLEGQLKDGQHRLSAIIKTGIPIKVIPVIINSDMRTDNKRRTGFWHILEKEGKKHVNAYSASVRILIRYETGETEDAFCDRSATITLNKMYEFYEENPLLEDSINKTASIFKSIKANVPHSILASIHYILSKKNSTMVDDFFDRIGLEFDEYVKLYPRKTDPMYQLKLILSQETSIKKIMPFVKAALIIKVLNYWTQNKPCKSLEWNCVGPKSEPFPILI